MLDALSGGRLDLGAGRGATLQEMTLCGVDPERTYLEVEESLRMISRMWLDDEFSWSGELEIAPHPILPRPKQMPHPPLFMACSKRDTVKLAAEYGVGALVLGFAGIDEVRDYHDLYRDTIANRTGERFVSSVVNDHFTALLPDDRARRRRRSAFVSAREASDSSPKRSRTGTAVARHRAKTPRTTTTWQRWRSHASA